MPNFNININTNGSYSNSQSNLFLRQFHSLNSSNIVNLSRLIDQSNGQESDVFPNSHHLNSHCDLNSRFGQNNRVLTDHIDGHDSNVFLNPTVGQSNAVVSQFHALNSSNNNPSHVIINHPNVPQLNANHFDFNSLVTTQNNRVTHVPNRLTVGQSQRGRYSMEASNNNYLPLPTQYSFHTSLDFIGGKLCLTQTVIETRKLLGPPITPLPTRQQLAGQTQTQVNHAMTVNGDYLYHQQQQPIHQNAPKPSPGKQQSASNMSGQGDNVDTVEEMSYDGMTHSLPCDKYGPYTCPSCKEVFSSSNLFASHVATHYKHESPEQRRRRRVARCRRKKPSDGIAAVVPPRFKRATE